MSASILVCRRIFPDVVARLREHFEVESNDADDVWSRDELIRRLQGKDGVFVTGTQAIDAALLDACPRLRAVCSRVVLRDGEVEVLDPTATQSFGDESSYYDIEPVDCPVGSVLVSFEGSVSDDGLVHHLRLSCAPIRWDGSELSLGAAQEVAANLGSPSSDGSGQGACPVGQLAAGIAGRAGSILDRFQLRCYQVTAAPE